MASDLCTISVLCNRKGNPSPHQKRPNPLPPTFAASSAMETRLEQPIASLDAQKQTNLCGVQRHGDAFGPVQVPTSSHNNRTRVQCPVDGIKAAKILPPLRRPAPWRCAWNMQPIASPEANQPLRRPAPWRLGQSSALAPIATLASAAADTTCSPQTNPPLRHPAPWRCAWASPAPWRGPRSGGRP